MSEETFSTTHEIRFQDSRNLEGIEDDSIDLVVTSPPYPMIEMWDELFTRLNPEIKIALENCSGQKAHHLMIEELNKTWKEIIRVLKEGGIACINIGDATRKLGNDFRLYSNHAKIIEYFEQAGMVVYPEIIWRKQSNKPTKFMGSGMLPTSAYVTQEHEYILIFRKGKARKFTAMNEKRYESAYFWEERNKWFSDIWFDLKGAEQE
ncbi:MAG: DNA-methyltransferase, partial [Candidatus Helarchaeales archaeon]